MNQASGGCAYPDYDAECSVAGSDIFCCLFIWLGRRRQCFLSSLKRKTLLRRCLLFLKFTSLCALRANDVLLDPRDLLEVSCSLRARCCWYHFDLSQEFRCSQHIRAIRVLILDVPLTVQTCRQPQAYVCRIISADGYEYSAIASALMVSRGPTYVA